MEEKPAAQGTPPPAPTPAPVAKPVAKPNLWTIIITVLVALILGVSAFIAYQLGQQKNQPAPAASVPTPSAPVIPTPTQKKIAYTKDNALWVVNIDGMKNEQIFVATPSGKVTITGTAWKDKDNLSYVLCADAKCVIYDYGITTKTFTTEVNAGPVNIAALAWNHNGTQLVTLYGPFGGPMKLSFKLGAVATVVKTFAQAGGRGGSLDDNVSIYFSPDDKYVLVTDTATQPNPTDKNTVWVFDASGKEIINEGADSGSWLTQARWIDAGSFVYKKGDKLYQRFVTSGVPPQVLPDPVGYNPVAVGGKIYSWTSGDLPKIGTMSGYYRPEVLDATHLVALKAKKLPPEEAMMMSFTTAGLSVIDLSTNKATDLDTGDITLFSVSP